MADAVMTGDAGTAPTALPKDRLFTFAVHEGIPLAELQHLLS